MITTDLNSLLPFILAGLVVLALAVWLIARANRKTTVIGDDLRAKDVLNSFSSTIKNRLFGCALRVF
mgnify:CR=1 FL=1